MIKHGFQKLIFRKKVFEIYSCKQLMKNVSEVSFVKLIIRGDFYNLFTFTLNLLYIDILQQMLHINTIASQQGMIF